MSKSVSVELEQLILGRELNFPIRDERNVLLLAAGAEFTSEVRRQLVACGIRIVVLDESDVVNTTVGLQTLSAELTPASEKVLLARLDNLVRPGLFPVVNAGRPLKSSMQSRAPDLSAKSEQRQQAEHQSACDTVSGLLHDATLGRPIDGRRIEEVTSTSINRLLDDSCATVRTAFTTNRDPSLAEHSVKVTLLAMAIGVEMGFDQENVRLLGMAGLVQDWGMSRVPQAIRESDRPLTPVEFLEVQKHPMFTVQMLEKWHDIPEIIPLVCYQVHERTDGSGYPRHREGLNIHVFARILHVADAFMAMTSARPHRPAMIGYVAMEGLLRQAQQRMVDLQVTRALLHIVSLFPVGSFVTLSDGSVAQVLQSNGSEYTKPVVLRVQDAQGLPIDRNAPNALVDLRNSRLSAIQALPDPTHGELASQPMAIGA